MQNKMAIVALVVLLLATSAWANPIADIPRSKAQADCKAELMQRYKGSWSTIEMLLERHMAAYDDLARIPDSPASNEILDDLTRRYYPSFGAIKTLYESNMDSYNRMR